MKAFKRKIAVVATSAALVLSSAIGFTLTGTQADEQVTAPLFSVTGGGASVTYGKHPVYAQDKEGLLVTLAKGDKFHVNQAIDLTGKTMEDTVLSMFPTPSAVGTSDAHFLSVTFTDAYDPDNFVVVTAWDPWQDGWGAGHCYVYTYPNGRTQAGLSSLSGKIEKGTTYGTESKVSFSGQRETHNIPQEVGDNELFFSFDYEERRLYAPGYVDPTSRTMVADYDDTDFYDELWNGFTTGEVFISIEAGNFKMSNFNFMITKIGDLDLSVDEFTPEKKPTLSVDLSAFQGEKPSAVVGEKFPFMPSVASSIYDEKVRTAITVTHNGEGVEVSGDGFVPTQAGDYAIKYVATDKYGNSTEETVEITASPRKGALALVTFGEKKNFLAGATDTLAKYYTYAGTAVGSVDVKITASLIGGNEVHEIDPETLEFTPQTAGEYAITYAYADYLGEHKKIEVVRVGANDDVVLTSEELLPDYFIKGAKYLLNEGGGYTYKNGVAELIKAQISVTENGVERALDSNLYEVNGDDYVLVTYKVANGDKSKSYSKAVKVVDVGYTGARKIEKYFDVTKGTVVGGANEESAYFDFATSGELRFINDVQGVNFYTQFSLNKGNVGGVNVFLTDAENPEQQVKLTYTVKGGKTQFFVNDGAEYNLSEYNLAAGGKAELTYDNDTQSVRVSKTQTIKIKNTVKGVPFEGFTSSKVKVSYAVFGVQEETRFFVYKINNQPMYDVTLDGDLIRPEVIASHQRGERKPGESITLFPIVIGDVLDPYVECTINVTDPDGNKVTDDNGVLLSDITDYKHSYTFTLTKMGDYTSRYVIKDGAGNRLPNTMKNTVVDKEEPKLTVSGGVATTAKVGGKVQIPAAAATDITYDGKQTALKVYVYLESPDGKVQNVSDYTYFTAKVAGRYALTYYTADENGNTSARIYYVNVTE